MKCVCDNGILYDNTTNSVNPDCPHCRDQRDSAAYEKHAWRLKNGEIIDSGFLEILLKNNLISQRVLDAARKKPVSKMIVGESGEGKTLLAKSWYNVLLKEYRGNRLKLLWIKESELFRIFRDEDETLILFEKLKRLKPEWVFVDDCFQPITWETRNAGRHYTNLIHENYWNFIDWFLYEPSYHVNVVMTANAEPEKYLNTGVENDKALLRRLRQVTSPKVQI